MRTEHRIIACTPQLGNEQVDENVSALKKYKIWNFDQVKGSMALPYLALFQYMFLKLF